MGGGSWSQPELTDVADDANDGRPWRLRVVVEAERACRWGSRRASTCAPSRRWRWRPAAPSGAVGVGERASGHEGNAHRLEEPAGHRARDSRTADPRGRASRRPSIVNEPLALPPRSGPGKPTPTAWMPARGPSALEQPPVDVDLRCRRRIPRLRDDAGPTTVTFSGCNPDSTRCRRRRLLRRRPAPARRTRVRATSRDDQRRSAQRAHAARAAAVAALLQRGLRLGVRRLQRRAGRRTAAPVPQRRQDASRGRRRDRARSRRRAARCRAGRASAGRSSRRRPAGRRGRR